MGGNPILSHAFIAGSDPADRKNPLTDLESWHPQRDLSLCYRLAWALTVWITMALQGASRAVMPRKCP
jgi:hypothetical protein